MIIRFNGKPSNPFENFSQAHKAELLKHYDPEHPERLLELINPDFIKSPSTCTEVYAKDRNVIMGLYKTVPTMVHLSCLCQLDTVFRTTKDTGLPCPTADVVVSLYSNAGLFTPLATGIKLIPENSTALWRITADLAEFKSDYKNTSGLDDLQKRLFLVLNVGLEIDVNKRPGYTNIKVTYTPSNLVVTDRTLITLTKKEEKYGIERTNESSNSVS